MICDSCRKPFHEEAHKLGNDNLCADCYKDIWQFRRKLRLILIVGLLVVIAFALTIALWPWPVMVSPRVRAEDFSRFSPSAFA
jgi:hypothetical protein